MATQELIAMKEKLFVNCLKYQIDHPIPKTKYTIQNTKYKKHYPKYKTYQPKQNIHVKNTKTYPHGPLMKYKNQIPKNTLINQFHTPKY